jgi:hypothetical protein
MGVKDQAGLRVEYVGEGDEMTAAAPSSELESTSTLVGDVYLLGFAVGISLLTLLGAAAGPLGLNRGTTPPDDTRLIGVAGATLVIVMLCAGEAVLRRWRRSNPTPPVGPDFDHLSLPSWYWVVPAGSASVWVAVAIGLSGGPMHLPGLAAVVALTVVAFCAESLIHSTTLLHTISPKRDQVLLSLWVASCLGVVTFLFISIGLWQGDAPLPGAWLAVTTVLLFIGNSCVFVSAGLALAIGLPKEERRTQTVLSRDAVRAYIGLDAAIVGIVLVIGVFIPLYAATRDHSLHTGSLNVIASMVFLPGLISAVVWVCGTGRHSMRSRRKPATSVSRERY